MKHASNVNNYQIQIMRIVTFLIILGAQVNIFIIMKVKIIVLVK